CYDKTRMDRRVFHILCMLKTIGKLTPTKYSNVEEMVAMFLYTVGHDVKHRVLKDDFVRSGETISMRLNLVLNVVLRLHKDLPHIPDLVPNNVMMKDENGLRISSHIPDHVLEADKFGYRSRKGEITTNVLACCSQNMQVIFVLTGWERSATNSRILRDAICRKNGLKVPQG
ncbi:LOW QUALITY PROTEIN: hypothetical protein CFOL_v3_01208, partial [Cephalotus follicularis]